MTAATQRRKALVVGASGMVGSNLLDRLARSGTWDIVTLSRRQPAHNAGVTHLAVDLLDPEQCRKAAPALADVTHIFFCARSVEQNYVIKVDANRLIVENLLDALLPVAGQLAHGQVVVGPEERVVAGVLRGPGHPELVVVVGALLGLDEDPQVHVATVVHGRPETRSRFPT